MRKSKPWGKLLIVIGTVFILLALSLIVWNKYTDHNGKKYSEKALSSLKNEIPNSDNSIPYQENSDNDDSDKEVKLNLDGNQYIGIISIPKIKLELPVLSSWSYANLDIAPCRYSGTVSDKNLVIAAHNYVSFFDKIDSLNSGDEIIFTECSGKIHRYEVSYSELINGTNAPAMEDNSEQWDLTLFTCTWSGWDRVTVRASEIKNDDTFRTIPLNP